MKQHVLRSFLVLSFLNVFFTEGKAQTREQLLALAIYYDYTHNQFDSLRNLLPDYQEWKRFCVLSGKDSVSLMQKFPDQKTYDSITWASAKVNLMIPIEKGREYKLKWEMAQLDSIETHFQADTLRSGYVWKHSSLVIDFSEGGDHYAMLVQTTFDLGEENMKTGERILLYRKPPPGDH